MNNEQIKKFALNLFWADNELQVEEILRKHNLWDDHYWQPLGNDDRNYAVIGNQSAKPVEALVEKIVNSIDAVLMRECLKRNIDPEGSDAPKNMVEAQEKFFNIKHGHLTNIGQDKRNEYAKNIYLTASGTKEQPCISIIDKGEGQDPKQFRNTLLSLAKSVKAGVKFVQGKWGQGGSGALVFGSPKHKFQLIISKRSNDISDNSSDWGVTVVRYFPPNDNQRMEIYKYLAVDDEILSFNSNGLDVIPYQEKRGKEFKFESLNSGTIIKLYQYNFNVLRDAGRVRSYITRHLNNQISTLLPSVPIPFTICDLRFPNEGSRTFNSLNLRLQRNVSEGIEDISRNKLIENQFSSSFNVNGEVLEARIYLFAYDYENKSRDQGRATFAENKEGVLYTCNGQTHAHLKDSFFKSKKVGMDVLANSLLVTLEFSQTSYQFLHQIFMNSRDRLRDSEENKIIQDNLAEIIKNNPGLRAAREKRIQQRANLNIKENKSFQDAIEKIIKQSKALTNILAFGNRIANPFSQIVVPLNNVDYEGKRFPTFFKTSKEYAEDKPRLSEQKRVIRVEFETDASNDYFSRDDDKGNFELYLDGELTSYKTISLYDGKAFLNIDINENFSIGSKYKFTCKISDVDKPEPLEESFWIKISPYKESKGGPSPKERKKPNPEDDKGKKEIKTHSGLNIPDIKAVNKDEWGDYDMDAYSGLVVQYQSEEKGYVYRVNAENIYLLNEIKNNKKVEPRILISKYALALSFIGLSILQAHENEANEDEDFVIQDYIKKVTSQISLVILPIVNSLGIDNKDLLDIVSFESDEFEDIDEDED